jgi:serine/threonine protein phosphatase PrpC
MNDNIRPFSAAKATAIGGRESNQDRCFFFDGGETLFMGVADGLGGHPRGEVAAQLLVDVCESRFRPAQRPLVDPEDFMLGCIYQAHHAIRRFGRRQLPPITPRTTAVLAVIQDETARWVHVGDSRLYLFRSGHVRAQTLDHAQTHYFRESAHEPPRARTSLTRCLGGLPDPPVTTCGKPFQLRAGDSLLLCSDGLWGQVPGNGLPWVFGADPTSLESRLSMLIGQAADQPGSDNVTAVALTWSPPLSSSGRPAEPARALAVGDGASTPDTP